MPTYAATTSVSWQSSRDEVERTLTRYGASQFMYGWTDITSVDGEPLGLSGAVVAFTARNRQIRFTLPLPDRKSSEFTHTPSKRLVRSAAEAEKAYDQAVRQRWRALALVIKAKLEATDAGISEFEEEFLANIVLPNGRTVAQEVIPKVKQTYEVGKMRPLLEIES
jgi:hypothetical protein